jgi:predicted nucleic acid-binding protein
MVRKGLVTWVSSSALSLEISRNPDPERRRDAQAILTFASEVYGPNSATAELARRIEEELGISPFDALHLATADQNGVDVFLTTDDDLLRRARRDRGLLHIRVENPVSWF